MKYIANKFKLEDLKVGETYMIDEHLWSNPTYKFHDMITKTSDDKSENIWLSETRPSPLPKHNIIGHINISKNIWSPHF